MCGCGGKNNRRGVSRITPLIIGEDNNSNPIRVAKIKDHSYIDNSIRNGSVLYVTGSEVRELISLGVLEVKQSVQRRVVRQGRVRV